MDIGRTRTFIFTLITCILCSCTSGKTGSPIASVKDGGFSLGGERHYYVGTNFWYGAILASEGRGGDRERLSKELDSLKALGMTNLRVLVGGDGPDGVPTRIEPTLQKEAGVYNDTIFRGLDYLLSEMGRRDMKAVLYLNNSWEWSGGFGMYLEWAGAGKALIPSIAGYVPFMEQMAGFSTNEKAQELFYNHIRAVVGRTNTVTGKPYKDDPAIFSWQIANEPRCFSADTAVQNAFVKWIWKAASVIKSVDPNHMVSTGSEGSWGCENDIALFERVHSSPDIDYLTMHIWPYNWSWVSKDGPQWGIDNAEAKTREYVDEHIEVAKKLGKPIVLEEFGYPRDDFRFEKGSPTTGRDRYYNFVFEKLVSQSREDGPFAGANFWGWAGYGEPTHENWQRGDAYTGDPAQEAQGLNSVFALDASTIAVIRKATGKLAAPAYAYPVLENDWMYTEKSQKPLRVVVKSQHGFKGSIPVTLKLITDRKDSYSSITKKANLRKGVDTLSFDMGLKSGFYKAQITIDGVPADDSFNVGCDPEDIESPVDSKSDFDAFWEEGLKALERIPVNATLTKLPEHSNDVRTTYRVDMDSYGGKRISGILVSPNKEGKYPARITYMGYGSDPWYSDPSSEPEVVEFTLSVRDQGLNKTPAQGWIRQGLDSRDHYYYRGAYLDCVRAVDFVASLPYVDSDRILAEGGSQGGAFTLVAASLDHRIRAIAPFVPFMSDFPDYFKIADWPANEILPAAKEQGIDEKDLLSMLSYFDVKNFTSRIQCPVLMGFGLQDPVCPPHTNFSGYNNIKAEKSWKCFPLSGHHVEEDPAWWDARNAFFKEYMN